MKNFFAPKISITKRNYSLEQGEHCANLWVFKYAHPPMLCARPHLTEKQKNGAKGNTTKNVTAGHATGLLKKTHECGLRQKKCACTPCTGRCHHMTTDSCNLEYNAPYPGSAGSEARLRSTTLGARPMLSNARTLCFCSLPRLLKCVLVNAHTEAMALLVQHTAKQLLNSRFRKRIPNPCLEMNCEHIDFDGTHIRAFSGSVSQKMTPSSRTLHPECKTV